MLELPNVEKSLWREAYAAPLYSKLTDDVAVDVAVVGAGITGLTTAYLLKQAGYTVAVLDKSTVGSGTTGRATGKVTSQHGLLYRKLLRRWGEQTARTYGEANQAAIAQIDTIVKKEKIDCEWRRDDHYVFTADPGKIETFRHEATVAANLGLPATLETDLPLPFEVQAAVKFANQGKIHSQKYLLGLAKAIHGEGSYIFEHSNVIGIRDGKPGRVRTSEATIIAKDIVVATNVPTFPLLARGTYCLLEYPTESYAVAGPGEALNGMYISPDKNHYSILPAEISGKSMLVIVGEGGNLSGLRLSKKARQQKLADYAEKWFGMTAITHRWSDRDYFAYDHIPLVGKLYLWSRHLYVATAFRKWGLTNGTVAGMILRDLVSSEQNLWAAAFNSSRAPIASVPRTLDVR